jgi:DNA helicase HerA-like ATPase
LPHSLIIGTTASGKTEFAKSLARRYKRRKVSVIVYDPFMDDWGDADLVTPDMGKFMKGAEKSSNCALFVDESGEAIGQYNTETFWLATRARHAGHSSHFITQRTAQLSPTVRDQCHNLFVFRVSPKDAEILSNEFVDEEIKRAPSLPQYHVIWKARFGEAREIDLDRRKRGRGNIVYLDQRRA